MGSGSRDVDAWHANGLYVEDRGLQVPMVLKHGPVTSRDKTAPGPDPRIRHRIQIGMFRPIRVDHTNCLQVAIKTHSFVQYPGTVHLETVERVLQYVRVTHDQGISYCDLGPDKRNKLGGWVDSVVKMNLWRQTKLVKR